VLPLGIIVDPLAVVLKDGEGVLDSCEFAEEGVEGIWLVSVHEGFGYRGTRNGNNCFGDRGRESRDSFRDVRGLSLFNFAWDTFLYRVGNKAQYNLRSRGTKRQIILGWTQFGIKLL